MKRILTIFLGIAVCLMRFGAQAFGQTNPTFSDDVAPIVYQKCAPCHRDGGIAPFSLTSYQQVVTYGFAVKNAVSSRHMPPWPPDPAYTRFKGERLLAQAEIDAITTWVDNNTQRGNPANDPPLPDFSDSSALPVHPQASWRIPTYTVLGSGDEYRCFVLPSDGNSTRWIKMLEMIPANKNVVHHILLYSDTTGTCRRLDSLDAGPGYTAVGGIGASQAELLGGWAPGAPPIIWPLSFGSRLRRRADLVMQIHYAPGSQGQRDSSAINMVFHPDGSAIREVFQAPVLNHAGNLTNGPLTLAPSEVKTFHARFPNFADATILSVFPHAHLLCRNWKVYATNLQGRDTIPLIRIPNWHFHWQGSYYFRKPVKIGRSMMLQADALYDNTANNPYNPSNPPQTVNQGEGTRDEMFLVYFGFTGYRPGDENLIIDSSLVTAERPVQSGEWIVTLLPSIEGRIRVQSSLPVREVLIADANGRTVYRGALPETGVPLGSQPNGIYFVQIENSLGRRKTLRWARM